MQKIRGACLRHGVSGCGEELCTRTTTRNTKVGRANARSQTRTCSTLSFALCPALAWQPAARCPLLFRLRSALAWRPAIRCPLLFSMLSRQLPTPCLLSLAGRIAGYGVARSTPRAEAVIRRITARFCCAQEQRPRHTHAADTTERLTFFIFEKNPELPTVLPASSTTFFCATRGNARTDGSNAWHRPARPSITQQ